MAVLLFTAVVLTVYLWARFYRAPSKVRSFQLSRKYRALYAGLPFLCLAFIAAVVSKWSSPDARHDPEWWMLYAMGGAVWLELGLFLLSLFGVGARDDVVERQNPSAAWVVYGAMMGATFCYAGSTIGAGPSIAVDLFCAVLSTGFLFGFWLVLERIFRLADRITIERDEGAGLRAGGWLSSVGLIFGGAVTGNWVSIEATLRDFVRYAWVAVPFLAGAIAIESVFKTLQMRRNAYKSSSMAIAGVYFLAAAVYVAWRGIH